jgi:hypothetical protein
MSTKLRNSKKHPYWALHTHTTKSARVKVQNIFLVRNNVSVAQIVDTQQLQHYIP